EPHRGRRPRHAPPGQPRRGRRRGRRVAGRGAAGVSGELAVDRLPEAGASLEVVLLADASFGADTEHGPRTPHRHDYHELIWTRSGAGRHLIDGEVSVVEPGTVTLIG